MLKKADKIKMKWIIIYSTPVVLLLFACCSKTTLVGSLSSLYLLDAPNNLEIIENSIDYNMTDPQARDILKSGWKIDGGSVRLEATAAILELNFPKKRDRIIRLLFDTPIQRNVKAICGSNELILNTNTRSIDWIEFAIPAGFQMNGWNEIRLSFDSVPSSRLERIQLLEGAARIDYAAVKEDSRRSILIYPEVTLRFHILIPSNSTHLEFETGVDDRSTMTGSGGGFLRLRISNDQKIHTQEPIEFFPQRPWNTIRLEIDKAFKGQVVDISFTIDSGSSSDTAGGVLAIAEPRILSKQTEIKPLNTLPSIILITLDACRADRLGFNGDQIIKSPALDKLARKGFIFADCVCQINNTPPSHYTILTSKRPQTHGVYDMVTPLSSEHRTVASLLKPVGYRTAAATSAAWLSALTHGLGPGFERFYAPAEAQRRAPKTYEQIRSWLFDRAKATDVEPYFAWIHLFDAHTPLDPPPPYDQLYYNGNPRDPNNHSMKNISFSPEQVDYMKNWMKDITDIRYFLAQYRSEITYMDRVLENLALMLSQTGARHKTWIIITADHGISLDEHNLYFIMAGMYEQQMHIPLVIIPPDTFEADLILDNSVQSLDIAPTIMDIAGQPIPPDFEGRCLTPLFIGKPIPDLPYTIAEHANNQAVMLRSSQYKYIKYIRSVYHKEPPIGLYDRQKDLQEMINLHECMHGTESGLDQQINLFLERPKSKAQTGAADSEELRKKLEALGYIQMESETTNGNK